MLSVVYPCLCCLLFTPVYSFCSLPLSILSMLSVVYPCLCCLLFTSVYAVYRPLYAVYCSLSMLSVVDHSLHCLSLTRIHHMLDVHWGNPPNCICPIYHVRAHPINAGWELDYKACSQLIIARIHDPSQQY